MKKKSGTNHKGFILIETLLSFGVITFAILFFYKGEVAFLVDIENKMIESRMYRVLYEEVVEGRKMNKSDEQRIIHRNGKYQVSYRLQDSPSAKITFGQQEFGIYREK
ncbi:MULTISPECIES: hypothetical protein [Enterococcus]|uniref:Uncharacterized protein n=1 Tax=Enterococcus alcedinis TaxID=1274384 RepID=A0A917JDM5_9ENTE|nr:hypothetical protein [Enterococcus alcedinis]MBP2101674.1 hypothetical protein [Enterococcus alcedinis]GGI64933.1 hypothetical protein GCM10011482_05870 [Enterococcus alcedinis]